MRKGGIGFFDSGIGGLTVLYACAKVTRGVPVYYYGDNARAPYGNRDINDIRACVREAFSVFERLNVTAVVIACNTVTALLLEELRAQYSFPIIGIEPAVFPAVKKYSRVLVLATNATVNSIRFQTLCERALSAYPTAEIRAVGCARLAGEIERMAKAEAVDVESLLPALHPQAVVLGCTHYSFIKDRIARFYGVETFDGNEGVAARLNTLLSSSRIKDVNGTLEGADKFSGNSDTQSNSDDEAEKGKLRRKRSNFPMDSKGFGKLSGVAFYSTKKDKNSPFQRSKKRFRLDNAKIAQSLYFLGSGRCLNCQFYERMFVFGGAGVGSG